MHFKWSSFLIKSAATVFLLYAAVSSDTTPSTANQGPEISWEKASAEIDSFPYSASFIDSVRDTLDCEVPWSPLRVISDYTVLYPETLVYTVSWGPVNAGYVVLTTLHDSINNTIVVGGKAMSNNFVSAFYKMRDYVISTIDAAGLYPLFFEQHVREGKKYKANEYVLFDHDRKTIHSKTRKKFKTVKSSVPFIHDYLSALHSIRATRRLAPGDTFSEQIFVDSKVHSIFFSVTSAEKRKDVDGGKFSCVVLTPRLVGNGRAFNKKDKLEIWISDDAQRMPVAIRSKIKFGAIDARLIWYNRKPVNVSNQQQ